MKITPYVFAALMLAAPLYLNSCSVVSQVRSVDVSSIPGLGAVAKAQEGMMAEYGQSAQLLLKSRIAALEALQLDAQAIADAKQAGDEYEKAKSIAAKAKDMMAGVQAQLTNVQNKPDMDSISKAIEETKGVDDFVKEANNEMSAIAGNANAGIAAQNAKGDKLVLAAMQHVDGANAKIAESYGLLQDAQMKEAELVLKATTHSAALVKGMKSASALDKAALGVQFRPIVYFLTGLPDELTEQETIKSMWQEHADTVAGIKLPARKQLPDVKAQAAKAATSVAKSFQSFSFL
ncbi:MAG: hypothetical protein MJ051_05715 [Akkermansia sp.]|nr:hypothetical protein [Akkermansia sp.]